MHHYLNQLGDHAGRVPNNLTLYRLHGFVGARPHLLALHEWLTGGDDLPAIAISGEQGAGKSTLAVATAWNHYYDFADGIIQVSPAGASPFRLYDVVRTMDTVLGTALTRASDDRWGISILEQDQRHRCRHRFQCPRGHDVCHRLHLYLPALA